MGQIPERNVIVTMVVTAAIALFLTALLLYCTLSSKVATRFKEAQKYFKDDRKKRLEANSLDHARARLLQRWRPRKTVAAKGRDSADVEPGTVDSRARRSLGSNKGEIP